MKNSLNRLNKYAREKIKNIWVQVFLWVLVLAFSIPAWLYCTARLKELGFWQLTGVH